MCFCLSFVCLFVVSKLEQEEIEKHITIYLSDLVPERGKQWHSHLCSGAGVEPPQSVPVPGKTQIQKHYQRQSAICSFMGVIIVFFSPFFSQGISPACSAALGRSPTWWKSTWRSQTRTSTLKVRGTRSQKAPVDCVCLFMRFIDKTVLCVCVALQVVFGSLYRDDVLIKPSRVVSILAAACMLQLVSTLNKVSCCLKCKIIVDFLSTQLYDTNLIKTHGLLFTGWPDSAVWRDHEGKHQCKDRVWLLCLCQYLWLGFSHEKVRFKFILMISNHSNWWVNQSFMLRACITMYMCLWISFCRCLEWLLNNLMTHQNVDLMKELGYACSAHNSLVFTPSFSSWPFLRYRCNFSDNAAN